MTKIFWVTCPQCKGEFYCHWQELRHKKIKLLCPYCSHQFLDEESPKNVRNGRDWNRRFGYAEFEFL